MSNKLTWTTQQRKISELVPFPDNPRRLTEKQAADLKKSLAKFDLVEIPAIDKDNKIIAGHQRLKLMVLDGRGEEVIDVRVPNRKLTDAEFLEYNLRSNKNTGEWDFDILSGWDEGLLKDVGFDVELDKIFGGAVPEGADDVPEPRKETDIKLGDIFTLGQHRVMCGDSTDAEQVARLMDGKKAVLMATDPPYGVALNDETGSGKKAKIQNDENDGIKLQAFLESVFTAWLPFISKNAAWYLWHAQMTQGFFAAAAAAAAGVIIHRQIIWVKPSLIMGHGDYHWRHELCFYGWVKGNRPEWYADRKQDTVWEIGRETDKIHPTAKPVEIFIRPMVHNTKREDICAEPFAGSGSQIIAAEQTGRICYSMEIDPIYVQVIIDRWEKLTGKKAVKVNEKTT